MYSDIQKLKGLKFSKTKTAKQLGINVKTVTKYWDMDADEFQKSQCVVRTKKLSPHKELILSWLKQYSEFKILHKYCYYAQIDPIGLQTLSHTFVKEGKVDVETGENLLEHLSINVTTNFYANTSSKDKQRAVDILGMI